MAATIAANLAAAQPTPVGIVVALWPPVCPRGRAQECCYPSTVS
jgi:hypothetical protein